MNTLLAENKEDYGVVREILPLHFLYPIISVQHYINTNLHGNYIQRLTGTVDSIKEKGMLHPLVVWKTTTEKWQELIDVSSNDELTQFTQPPMHNDIVHVVMCGCRRLYAAVNLGYTEVECLVAYSLKNTSRICPQQRKAFKGLDTVR
jgi:hypothetical protein